MIDRRIAQQGDQKVITCSMSTRIYKDGFLMMGIEVAVIVCGLWRG